MSKKWPVASVVALVVVAAALLFSYLGTRGSGPDEVSMSKQEETTPNKVTHVPEPAVTEDVGSESGKDDDLIEEAIEITDASFRQKIQPKFASNDRLARRRQLQRELWVKEDEVFITAPKYPERKEEVREKALELIKAESVALDDKDAVLELAQRELDTFWDMGSLASLEAYDHAYTARAVLEIALEKTGDDFDTLFLLTEAISTTFLSSVMNPDPDDPIRLKSFLTIYRSTDNLEYVKHEVLACEDVINRKGQMILSGDVEPSTDAVIAMYNWVILRLGRGRDRASDREAIPGYQWIVDNADKAGESWFKEYAERSLKEIERGELPFTGNKLYFIPSQGDESDEDILLKARNNRRFFGDTLRGSKEFRSRAQLRK